MRAFPTRSLALSAVAVPLMVLAAAASLRYVGSSAAVATASAQVPQFRGMFGPRQQRSMNASIGGEGHSFYFTRAIYGGYGGRSWTTDYPTADQWIVTVLRRLTFVDAFPSDNAVALDDPELRRYPFLYAVEVGGMALDESEVEGLRNYLLAGGFLVVDDFWGTYEWENFEREISRVLPEYDIVDVGLDHPIFQTFYLVDEIVQVPNIGQGRSGGPTHERDGYVPHFRGIFDEHDRLMVAINWNTDLGDAWEWAEDPYYPLHFSTYAYQMAANFIMYAMTR